MSANDHLAAAILDALDDEAILVLAERLRPVLGIRGNAADDDLLDAKEAAEYLRCPSVQRIYDLRHAGEITPQRDGRRLLFRRAELDRYLRERSGR